MQGKAFGRVEAGQRFGRNVALQPRPRLGPERSFVVGLAKIHDAEPTGI
jgi:hypothetical protein